MDSVGALISTRIINQNPQFISIINNDYNYQETSPCIDSGDPQLTDPDQTRSDIGGQFYNQNENECNGLINGDVNQDNVINILDVITLVNLFFQDELPDECTIIISDLDNDGVINILDIVQLVSLILNRT